MAPPPGNAWHFPGNDEPLANYNFMRSPLYPIDPPIVPPAFPQEQNKPPLVTPDPKIRPVTVLFGSQSRGDIKAGDMRTDISVLKYKPAAATKWITAPVVFEKEIGNNKYFSAVIPTTNFDIGVHLLYYLSLSYTDRDPAFVAVDQNDPTGWASGVYTDEAVAQSRSFPLTVGTQNEQKPFMPTTDKRTEVGEWSNVFLLPNVAAHAALLRNEKILMWGRRGASDESMNTLVPDGTNAKPATCAPFLLDIPKTDKNGKTSATWTMTQKPFMPEGSALNIATLPQTADQQKSAPIPRTSEGKINANLFCSGHAFLPSGDLMVAGGHLSDQWGIDQTCIYELTPKSPQGGVNGSGSNTKVEGAWKAIPAQTNGTVMGNGRWYPTVTTLPEGACLVASGTFLVTKDGQRQTPNNNITQFLKDDKFITAIDSGDIFDLYPRMHVASTGILYSVSLVNIYFLDINVKSPSWQPPIDPRQKPGDQKQKLRDYGSSVMYDKDKVVYIGGGIRPPTQSTSTIDLSGKVQIAWSPADDMMIRRRQHNATVLPDGTVLVTGGTRGDAQGVVGFSDDVAFNDLRPGQPVHVAELWNPNGDSGKQWTGMASESVDRCYHATAILLPDGRVLSAGGGEFQLGPDFPPKPNLHWDSHTDAQVFSPPYLFIEGPRPRIDSVSVDRIICGSKFDIVTAEPSQIAKINLIGLSSVTHSNNTGQRLVPLKPFVVKDKSLTVPAPPDTNSCPPGYYMLFIINKKGQPSVGQIIQVIPSAEEKINSRIVTSRLASANFQPSTTLMLRDEVREKASGTRVELGITPTCPYGLSACWGGAFEALSNLEGVELVDPIPHTSGSTASVFLKDTTLPNLPLWTSQFKSHVGETYRLRGFEAALDGTVEVRNNDIVLTAIESMRPEVRLLPLKPDAKVQWDKAAQRPQLATEEELGAFADLKNWEGRVVSVTGPVSQGDAGYVLQVRLVTVISAG